MTTTKAGYCVMNYTIGCRDIDSGEKGCFLFDIDRYRRYGDFRAISEVFPDVLRLIEWSRANGDPCKGMAIDRIQPMKASDVWLQLEQQSESLVQANPSRTEPEFFWALLAQELYSPQYFPNARFRMDGGMLVIEPSSSRSPWYFDEGASEKLVVDGDLLIARDQQGFAMEFKRCSASGVPAAAA